MSRPIISAYKPTTSKFCPVYPPPTTSRWQLWWRMLRGRNSLIEEQANFPKHRYMGDLLRPLLDDSIFTTNGPTWASQRKLMEPAFEQTRMDNAFPLMRAAADTLRSRVQQLPSGSVCDVESEMTHFTADVMFRTIFSEPLAAEDAERIFRAFADFQAAAPKATMPRYRPQFFKRWFGSPYAAHTQVAAQEIRALLHKLVAPRHAAYQAGQVSTHADILASLLPARTADSQRALGVDELVNEIAVLFLAGHETSASALAWTLHFLAHSPDVQARVHAEVTAVIGTGAVELEHLRQVDLTRRVFRETLRSYPPLGFLVREAQNDTCLRDKTIPAGASTVVSPWLIHRHRDYWERPDEFDPDRFFTESGRASAASAFLPFSLGPRECVDAGFALRHWGEAGVAPPRLSASNAPPSHGIQLRAEAASNGPRAWVRQ